MKKITLFAASVIALSFTACGSAEDSTQTHSTHNHAANGEEQTTETAIIGHAIGTIISVAEDGNSITIDHGAFEGIQMGAMTMGFGIQGDVDLSGFSAGDAVAFMAKQGRDHSYRVTAICNTANDGDDCLDAHMSH